MFWSLLFIFFFEMRPSCSPQSFLLVTFQECSLVLSMTKLLGACWRSLPGERNIDSRVFSAELFTKSEASFLSCQWMFCGVTLKISPSEEPSLLWSRCKQQSRAVPFPLLHVKVSPWAQALLLPWCVPFIPFRCFTGCFVTAVLCTLSWKAECKASHFDYWMLYLEIRAMLTLASLIFCALSFHRSAPRTRALDVSLTE